MEKVSSLQPSQFYAAQKPAQPIQNTTQPAQKENHNSKKKLMMALGGLAVLGATAVVLHKKGLDQKALGAIKEHFSKGKNSNAVSDAINDVKDVVVNNTNTTKGVTNVVANNTNTAKSTANVVDNLTHFTNGTPKNATVNKLFEFEGGKLTTDKNGTKILESLDGTKAKVTTQDGVTTFYDFTGKYTRKIVDADGNIRITRLTKKPTNLAQDIQSTALSVADSKSMATVNAAKELSTTAKAGELVKQTSKKVSQSKITDVKIDEQFQKAVEAYKKCQQEPTVENAKVLAKLIHPDKLIHTTIDANNKDVVEMNAFVSRILTAAKRH